jgi:hypothetical protein
MLDVINVKSSGTAKISLHVHHNHNVLLTFGPSYMLAISTDGNASGEIFT